MAENEDKDAQNAPEEEAPASSSVAAVEDGDDAGKAAAEEEDTGAQVAPIVKLEEVSVSTGEENEDVLLDMKAKLYRFDREGNQWKERGVGQVRLLKHKETGKIRLLMRQSRTLKICANHMVLPSTALQEHAGSDKTWVWHATDYSDGELKKEFFCIRFGNVENAQKFKAAFEEAQEAMSTSSEENVEAAESAAELLENLKVEEKAEETKGLSVQEKENVATGNAEEAT